MVFNWSAEYKLSTHTLTVKPPAYLDSSGLVTPSDGGNSSGTGSGGGGGDMASGLGGRGGGGASSGGSSIEGLGGQGGGGNSHISSSLSNLPAIYMFNIEHTSQHAHVTTRTHHNTHTSQHAHVTRHNMCAHVKLTC